MAPAFSRFLLCLGCVLLTTVSTPLHAASAWRTTVPAYPPAALAQRIAGQGTVRVTTDDIGWVTAAHMTKSTGSKILDAATVNFALTYWQGPSHVTANLPVEYRLPPPSSVSATPRVAHPGWTIPRHAYPIAAGDVYEQGTGVVRATTDPTGHVTKAVMVRSTGHARLDADAVAAARDHWRGPASASIEVPMAYRLDTAVPVVPPPGPGRRWNTPKPYYPGLVLKGRGTGSGLMHVSTDARGRVVRAAMSPSTGNAALDENTVNYALARWSGPPNAVVMVPVTYRIER